MNHNENFSVDVVSTDLPKGLFSRVLRRLGLEKELIVVRENLRFFSILLVTFFVLSIFAFIGLRHVLAESSFGQFLSLMWSDPDMAIIYWRSYSLSVFESMPGSTMAMLLVPLALFTLFIKFVGYSIEKLMFINRSINKQKSNG